ncbi:hypothetical protein NI25_00035 [Streptomyces sp. CCM_MD2014]|nr:hypothetical protein NI25_00035 [Streptomyces sp. CCM_MD2014]
MLTAQHSGVVAGVGGVGLEEGAQFDGGAAHLVEGASGAGALRGSEPLGEVIQSRSRSHRWETAVMSKLLWAFLKRRPK